MYVCTILCIFLFSRSKSILSHSSGSSSSITKSINSSTTTLSRYVDMILNAIFNSADQCPSVLRVVLRQLWIRTAAQFNQPEHYVCVCVCVLCVCCVCTCVCVRMCVCCVCVHACLRVCICACCVCDMYTSHYTITAYIGSSLYCCDLIHLPTILCSRHSLTKAVCPKGLSRRPTDRENIKTNSQGNVLLSV